MKFRVLFLTVVLVIICLPGVALAGIGGFDEYGMNERSCTFIGTLDNWDACLYGEPALPVPPPDTPNVIFLARKWSRAFYNGLFNGEPWSDDAWLATYGYQYLSGEQEGSLWQVYFAYKYMSAPPEDAVPVPGMPGMYFIVYKEWLTDQTGNETILVDIQLDISKAENRKFNNLFHVIKSLMNRLN